MQVIDDKNLHQRIKAEQIKLLYKHSLSTLSSVLVLTMLFVIYFWDEVPKQTLITWAALNVVLTVARAFMTLIYMRTKPEAGNWGIYFTIAAALSGAMWGSTSFLLIDSGSLYSIIFVGFALAGITAGSLVALSSFLPAYFAFTSLVMFPLIFVFASYEDTAISFLAILSALYLLLSLVYSKATNATLKESLRLRFENISLVQNLKEQKEIAEKASGDKTRFLAAASHDLRQPMQALGMFIEAMGYVETNPGKREMIEKTKHSYQAMSDLLKQLLDISKLDAGAVRPVICAVELQPLLSRIVEDHKGEASRKRIKLRFRPTTAVVYADSTMLSRIVSNLLSNAVRYTEKGGILLAVRKQKTGWAIVVYDTGQGIAKEKQEAVFQEFVQLGNPERNRKKGLGLGLAIVFRLARMMKAEVSLNSTVKRGSSFSVVFPAASKDGIAKKVVQRDINSINLNGLKVVVIDDDQTAKESITALLSVWDCDVRAFDSEAECLQKLENTNWVLDALIVDYRLRDDKTGADAIEAIHHTYKQKIPALIITGDTAPERILEAQAKGFPLLHKPVDPNQLQIFLSKQAVMRKR